MLGYMRKNANSLVVWLIIIAIAIVFVFFGIGGGGGGGQKIMVNGEEANLYEYDRLITAITRSQGTDYSPESQQMIKVAAVSELIGQMLINQFAREVRLTPTDWAVGKSIASIPEFQVDGRFDRSRYAAELATMNMNTAFFEDSTRREMLVSRVGGLVGGLSQVLKPEALEIYHFQEDRVAFDYMFFPASRHEAGLEPGDEQLTGYYIANQERWRQPARMTVEYVEINPADFLDKVQVTEEELLDYYTEYNQRFTNPESVEVSHILIKFPKMNPTEEEKIQTLERAQAIFERAKIEDFATLAREISEDPGSGPLGGSLGTVVRGMTFEKFEKAAFDAPVDEVTPPVETEIGYHLIKVASHRQAGSRPFEEVRAELENEQKALKARQAAITQLEDLIIRTETNPKLADAAASMNLMVLTSPEFTEADPPEIFENEAEALKKAFTTPVGKVGEAIETDEHLALFAPVARQESRIPSLDEVREEVKSAWIAAEAGRMARADALAFIEKAGQSGWEAAAEGGPAKRGRTELATRSGLVGQPPFEKVSPMDLFAAIHSVAKAGEISPLPAPGELDGERGAFVLALADYQAADEAVLDGPMGQTFMAMMSMNKGNMMYQVWRSELYEASQDEILVPQMFVN